MRKTIFFIAMCIATVASAQTATINEVMEIVSSISKDVQLSSEQTTQITDAAIIYIETIQTANSQHENDETALVLAKATAWQDFTMQLRTILSDEQYKMLKRQQNQHRQDIINQIQGGQK